MALFDHGNFRHPSQQSKKKKGGQPGHADTNREAGQVSQPFESRRLFAPVCGHCGTALPRVEATRQKVLLDIVLQPEVVKLLVASERQWCGHLPTRGRAPVMPEIASLYRIWPQYLSVRDDPAL